MKSKSEFYMFRKLKRTLYSHKIRQCSLMGRCTIECQYSSVSGWAGWKLLRSRLPSYNWFSSGSSVFPNSNQLVFLGSDSTPPSYTTPPNKQNKYRKLKLLNKCENYRDFVRFNEGISLPSFSSPETEFGTHSNEYFENVKTEIPF